MNLKLGIVGWPLTKTYSPLIHKLLGEFLGINVEYQKVPIENLDRQKIQDVNSKFDGYNITCLLYTSPSPRDQRGSRMPSSA